MNNLERDRIIAALLKGYQSPPSRGLGLGLGSLTPPPPNANLLNALQAFQPSALPLRGLGGTPHPPEQQKKRDVFFSFHFDDIIRVNNVRRSQQFKSQAKENVQSVFYDRSLWESVKRTDPESLKRLIREGVQGTSVVCVLIGTQTWQRPWVRYEIARSVIDGKGLLAIDINSINHHKDRIPHAPGPNPLDYMAVGKMADGTYRLFERKAVQRYVQPSTSWALEWVWEWHPYEDYTNSVPLPRYLQEPAVGYVTPLSTGTHRYDCTHDDGWKNMGRWFDLAATRAGR